MSGKGHSKLMLSGIWNVCKPLMPGAGRAGGRPKSYGDNFAVARKGFPIWPHPGFNEDGTEKKA